MHLKTDKTLESNKELESRTNMTDLYFKATFGYAFDSQTLLKNNFVSFEAYWPF